MDAGVADRLARVKDRSTLRVTTRGRRTGKAHTVPVWFVADGATLYLATLNVRRDWVRNVAKTPAADFDLGDVRLRGRVSTLTDRADIAAVHRMLTGKYWLARIGSWLGQGPARTFRVNGLELIP